MKSMPCSALHHPPGRRHSLAGRPALLDDCHLGPVACTEPGATENCPMDISTVPEGSSVDDEWQARVDLAAVYRLLDGIDPSYRH